MSASSCSLFFSLASLSAELLVLKQALDLEVFGVDIALAVEERYLCCVDDGRYELQLESAWGLYCTHHVVSQTLICISSIVGATFGACSSCCFYTRALSFFQICLLSFFLDLLFENLEEGAGRKNLRDELGDALNLEVLRGQRRTH